MTDQKYLNWRYADPRSGQFIILLAEEETEYVGYLVLRINKHREDYSVGFIADILCLDNRSDVIMSLLSRAVLICDEANVNIVNFLAVKGYQYEQALMKHGFLDSHRNHFIYYTHLQGIDYLKNLNRKDSDRIHFCFGDLDVI